MIEISRAPIDTPRRALPKGPISGSSVISSLWFWLSSSRDAETRKIGEAWPLSTNERYFDLRRQDRRAPSTAARAVWNFGAISDAPPPRSAGVGEQGE